MDYFGSASYIMAMGPDELSEADYIDQVLGMNPGEYYMMQDICQQTKIRQQKRTA